ncbi:hypothetical protein M0R72_10385 [Candidatus Pacearchaeota archaeon]|jgi:hypothetical protein|nr:hypothetical protein [Candidatus Pacearchaeota archaeon]
MTPELSILVSKADAAKQALLLAVAVNETAAQQALQAKQWHEECYAAVQKAMAELTAARAAINGALDADYGAAINKPATPETDVTTTTPMAEVVLVPTVTAVEPTPAVESATIKTDVDPVVEPPQVNPEPLTISLDPVITQSPA